MGKFGNDRRFEKSHSSPFQGRANNDRQGKNCFTCGKDGHFAKFCPDVQSKKCFKCGEDGHFSRDCTNKSKRPRNNEPVSLDFPDYVGTKLHELPEDLLDGTEVKRPTEPDVGISTYLNKHEAEIPQSGFNCILKHRYSDFNVNEISLNGEVVYLTNLELPSCDEKPTLNESLSNVSYPSYDDLGEDIKKWVTPVCWSRLLMLTKKFLTPDEIEKMPSKSEVTRIDVSGSEKEERKAVHTWVKEQFPHLNSDGAMQESNDPNKKYIVLSYAKTDKFQTSEANKWLKVWPRDREEKFLHFTLYKEDSDQAELFSRLNQILLGSRYQNQNHKPDFKNSKYSFKAAGNKDKRARTSQRVAIKHVMAVTMKDAVKKLNSSRQRFQQNRDASIAEQDRIAIGNYEYKKNDIDMGDLKGNRFTIVLRNFCSNGTSETENGIQSKEEKDEKLKKVVDSAMHSLEHKGFINYFGLQRFGNMLFPKTSDVGLAMIKEDWKKVVELILYPRKNEPPSMMRVRAHWWMYRNANDALRLFENHKKSSIEAILLKGLVSHHENDIVGALLRIPKHSLLLYMHAYQALIWNKVVSRRIEQFGDEVLVGDLVQLPEGVEGNLSSESNGDFSTDDVDGIQLTRNSVSENMEENENTKSPTANISEADRITEANEIAFLTRLAKKKKRLSYVTEDTLNDFKLQDVVMVVPGHGVSYPQNAKLKQLYLEALKEDGLENGFEDLRNRKDRRFSLTGDYRKMIGKAEDLKYHLIRYSDPNQNLTLSDMDIYSQTKDIKNEADGKYLALVMKMSLASSGYATMALRELTRIETGKTQCIVHPGEAQEQKMLNENLTTSMAHCNEVIDYECDSKSRKMPKLKIDLSG